MTVMDVGERCESAGHEYQVVSGTPTTRRCRRCDGRWVWKVRVGGEPGWFRVR